MEALIARFSQYCDIGDAERDALCALTVQERIYNPGDDVIEKGQEPGAVLIITSGWAARYIALKEDRSQILNFLLPGDMYDMQVFIADAADHSVAAVTRLTVLAAKQSDILKLFAQNNNLGLAFWWTALQEEAILREQVVRNGRRSAIERVAHLILELHRRAQIIGQGGDSDFRLPVSQVLIADALGLSYVHISRVLRKLTEDNLIEREKDRLTIKDRDGLAALCDFSPAYLHLDAEPPSYYLRQAMRDVPS